MIFKKSVYVPPNFVQFRNISYKKLMHWYSGLVTKPPPAPPYKHVTQIGDPVLRSVCDPVPPQFITSPKMKHLIERMKYVLHKSGDCVGISAPQIGVNLRVFLIQFTKKHAKGFTDEEYKNRETTMFPLTVVINPELRVIDFTKVTFNENCLSVVGFHADVPRYKAVEIKALNEDGELITIQASGWLARILQHEMDHLNGKLFTDIMDRKSLTCSCWEVVNERCGKVELPYWI